MAARRTARVTIQGEDRLSSTTRKAGNSFEKFGGQLRAFSAIAAGIAAVAIGKLGQALNGAIDLAAAAETSFLSVAESLRQSGEAADTSAEEIRAWSDALEDVVGVSKEQIETGFRLAQSFGASATEARALTEAALDFAQGAELNFLEALRRLGRATRGSTADVANFIPEIRDLTRSQLDAASVAELVADRFGGAAARALEGYSGAVTRAKIATDEYAEAIGRSVIESDNVVDSLELQSFAFQQLTEQQANQETFLDRIAAGWNNLKNLGAALLFNVNRLGLATGFLTEKQKENAEVTNDQADAVERLTQAQERELRIQRETNEALEDARAIAAELGFTLEEDLNRNLRENEDTLIRLDDLYKQGVITRRDFEFGQNQLSESTLELNERIEATNDELETEIETLDRGTESLDRFTVATTRAAAGQRALREAAQGGGDLGLSGGAGSTILAGTERTTGFTLGGGTFTRPVRTVNPPGSTRGTL